MKRALLAIAAVTLAACAHHAATRGPENAEIPVGPATSEDDAEARAARGAPEAPPPSGPAKHAPFPTVRRETLPNGLVLATAEAHALPIAQLRVVVHAGTNYGKQRGVAELCGQLLKDGGTRSMTSEKLLERVESLGAALSIATDFDATTLAIGVTKPQIDEALAILAEVVREPRFDPNELAKLKAREKDDAEEAARGDGTWAASRVLFAELFPPASPYAAYEVVPADIAKITPTVVREFYDRFYVPKNVEIIAVGDLDPAAVRAAVLERFGAWKGGDPPQLDFPAPHAPAETRVVVADRAKSAQSDIFVATLAPERRASEWPDVRVVAQALGGGPSSRLFQDLREEQSLAYTTRATVLELAHGKQPLVAYAGTQTPKTALAVQALLDHSQKAASAPFTTSEVSAARRFLGDVFAIRMETIGAIADLLTIERALLLPDGYWDAYRAELSSVDAARASAAARAIFGAAPALIVVAGDADAIAEPLTRFGQVTVADPEHGFRTVRTLPKSAPAR